MIDTIRIRALGGGQGTATSAANYGADEIASPMAPFRHGEYVFNGTLNLKAQD